MKNKYIFKTLTILLLCSFLIAGCMSENQNSNKSSINASEKSIVATSLSSIDTDDGDDDFENQGSIFLGEDITFEGDGISIDKTTISITKGGDYTITGTLNDGMICVNTKEKVKLRLNSVNITNSKGPAIYFEDSKKAFITLSQGSTNYLTDGNNYSIDAKGALCSNDTLEIKGSGTLYVTGNYKHGIASDDDIIIEEGNIIIKAVTDGLHANDNITIDGGNIEITCDSDGFESEGSLIINSGTITVDAGDDGVHAETELQINGGEINVKKSNEGIESKDILTINNGNMRINSDDDAINSGTDLVINDGYIYAECNGDGFDSNGSMTINGGTILVFSGNNANGPLDIGERNATCTINGGIIIATGGNMTIPIETNSKQYSVWINEQIAKDAIVNISSENGENIDTFKILKGCSSIFYSSNKLKSNVIYNVNTGGTIDSDEKDGLYTSGNYENGSLLGSFTTSSINSSVGQSMGPGSGGRNKFKR